MSQVGRVREARIGGVHVLRIEGTAGYSVAPAVERFLDDLFARQQVGAVLVDLTAAEWLDSTMLGVIARVANRLAERGGPRPTIACPPGDLLTLLETMGFDQFFDVVSDAPAGAAGLPVIADAASPRAPTARELAHTVLRAHQALAAMNPDNAATFRDVVAQMSRELEGEG